MGITVVEKFSEVRDTLVAAGAPAEQIEFIQSRIDLTTKAQENAKTKRLEKNGGEKKDICQSEFYSSLRDAIYKVMTTELASGDELVVKSGFKSASGKAVLAAQVATALSPLVADGTVVVGQIKVETVGKDGLKKEALRKAYKLA